MYSQVSCERAKTEINTQTELNSPCEREKIQLVSDFLKTHEKKLTEIKHVTCVGKKLNKYFTQNIEGFVVPCNYVCLLGEYINTYNTHC